MSILVSVQVTQMDPTDRLNTLKVIVLNEVVTEDVLGSFICTMKYFSFGEDAAACQYLLPTFGWEGNFSKLATLVRFFSPTQESKIILYFLEHLTKGTFCRRHIFFILGFSVIGRLSQRAISMPNQSY